MPARACGPGLRLAAGGATKIFSPTSVEVAWVAQASRPAAGFSFYYVLRYLIPSYMYMLHVHVHVMHVHVHVHVMFMFMFLFMYVVCMM